MSGDDLCEPVAPTAGERERCRRISRVTSTAGVADPSHRSATAREPLRVVRDGRSARRPRRLQRLNPNPPPPSHRKADTSGSTACAARWSGRWTGTPPTVGSPRRPVAASATPENPTVRKKGTRTHDVDPNGENPDGSRIRLSSRTPTSRCRCATSGHQVRARGSPPEAGRAATGTRVVLRSRSRLPVPLHVLP